MFDNDISTPALTKRILQLVYVLLLFAVIAVFVNLASEIRDVFFCFAIALLINYLLAKPVELLTEYIRLRFVSVLIIYLGFIAALSFLISVLVPASFEQLLALKKAMPSLVSNIYQLLLKLQSFFAVYQIDLPITIDRSGLLNLLVSWIPKVDYYSVGNIATTVLSGSLFVMAYVVLTIILSFYLLVDGNRAWQLFIIPFSKRMQFHLCSIKEKVDKCLYALLFGQMEIATLTAIVMLITYLILKVPYALLFALAQMLEIIPVIGTWTAIIPCIIIICFTSGISKGLFAFVVYLIYSQIFRDNFVTPRIMGSNLGYHPLAIIFAMFFGAQFGGLPGVVLALPILAIILSVVDYNVELKDLKVRKL